MTIRITFSGMLLTIVLAGCPLQSGEEPATDAWYSPPPSGLDVWAWEVVPTERVHEVAEANLAQAESQLATVWAVEVDLATASQLVGTQLTAIPGTTPYLVRAVADQPGAYDVHVNGTELYIESLAFGFQPAGAPPFNILRRPLVIFLAQRPVTVYTDIAYVPI